jgi:PPOX class probable F420-dependent enzyme
LQGCKLVSYHIISRAYNLRADRVGRCNVKSGRVGSNKGHEMARIPDSYLDLLQQKKAFANLATIMPDGSPQVTPVWVDYADGVVRFNTAKGRVKARNLKSGSPVALAVMDPDNPYRSSRSAAVCGTSPSKAPMRISTSSPRNT